MACVVSVLVCFRAFPACPIPVPRETSATRRRIHWLLSRLFEPRNASNGVTGVLNESAREEASGQAAVGGSSNPTKPNGPRTLGCISKRHDHRLGPVSSRE